MNVRGSLVLSSTICDWACENREFSRIKFPLLKCYKMHASIEIYYLIILCVMV